jgi:hypothetical protein
LGGPVADMANCDGKNTRKHDLNFVSMHNLDVDAPFYAVTTLAGK